MEIGITLYDFLTKRTQVGELCIICEDGWRLGAGWIDNEDLFLSGISNRLLKKRVKSDGWDKINIKDKYGKWQNIPCHYINV